MIRRSFIAMLFLVFMTGSVFAGGSHSASGEVKSVSGEKVSISHGPIKSMGMGAMTMSFGVVDPAMLKDIKAGQKIKFTFEEKNKQLVITEFEAE